jgi:hypothetical protein
MTCPACKSDNYDNLRNGSIITDPPRHFQEEKYQMVICEDCHNIYARND